MGGEGGARVAERSGFGGFWVFCDIFFHKNKTDYMPRFEISAKHKRVEIMFLKTFPPSVIKILHILRAGPKP